MIFSTQICTGVLRDQVAHFMEGRRGFHGCLPPTGNYFTFFFSIFKSISCLRIAILPIGFWMKRGGAPSNAQKSNAKPHKGGGFGNYNNNSTRKAAPYFKIIPGTQFLVDGFQYKDADRFKSYFLRYCITAWLTALFVGILTLLSCELSHFHADHYQGITKGFNHGKICTYFHIFLIICLFQSISYPLKIARKSLPTACFTSSKPRQIM